MNGDLRWYETVGLLVVGLTAVALIAWLSTCSKSGDSQPGLVPSFGRTVSADKVAWASDVWPNVMRACPGLAKFGADLSVENGSGYFVDGYFDGRADAVIAVVRVAHDPLNRELNRYRASGHHCFFAIDYPTAAAVQVAKAPCQALCLDRQTRDQSGEDLRLSLR